VAERAGGNEGEPQRRQGKSSISKMIVPSIALVQVDDGWPWMSRQGCLNRSAVPSISTQSLGSRQVARSTWSKPLASPIVVGVNPCHSTASER